MSAISSLSWLSNQKSGWTTRFFVFHGLASPQERLETLSRGEIYRLPGFVRACPVAMKYFHLFSGLDWEHFPDRPLQNRWPNALRLASFAAAHLVKIDQHMNSQGQLRQFLVEHPALIWVLGFPLHPDRRFAWGFDASASLPTVRHLDRLLRLMPNISLQFLLDETVRQIRAELATDAPDFGECISMDTKHILAWVKENNPKAYISDRYDKTKQPAGDLDCKLGCKRRHNQSTSKKNQKPQQQPPTPTTNPAPGETISVGEYYWGYASGVVAVKVPGVGEFVLAELTLPFDRPDVAYFFPLMADVERRLGFRPRFGALDAAYDAFYIYEYFHRDDDPAAFAAVPFAEKGGYKEGQREFNSEGLPLCEAHLPMPLKFTFTDRTRAIIEHERGKYVCPLLFPEPGDKPCPINHENWATGGCSADMPTSIGARLRYTLQRNTEAYKQVYKQRTATERINALAKELGIERPMLRNRSSIANHNTLIYVLLNVRALMRIRQRPAKSVQAPAA